MGIYSWHAHDLAGTARSLWDAEKFVASATNTGERQRETEQLTAKACQLKGKKHFRVID
jgi:hypothetical protein